MTFFGWLLSFCGEGKGWKKNDWTFLANLRCNVCHKSANWRCRTNWNSSRYMEIERATFISRNAYFFLCEEDLQMFSVETEYFLWIFSWNEMMFDATCSIQSRFTFLKIQRCSQRNRVFSFQNDETTFNVIFYFSLFFKFTITCFTNLEA